MMASGPEKIKGRYPPLRPKAGSLASTNLRLQPLSDQGRGLAIDDAVQLFRRHQLAIPNGCPLVTIVQNMQSNPLPCTKIPQQGRSPSTAITACDASCSATRLSSFALMLMSMSARHLISRQNWDGLPPGSRPTRTSRSKTLEMKAGRHSQTNWRAQERPHSEPRFHLMCFDASIRAIM